MTLKPKEKHTIDQSVRPETLTKVNFAQSSLAARALRRLRQHAPRQYIKAIAMDWRYCDFTPFAATDGRFMYINQTGLEYLAGQDDPCGLIAFLFLHETLHAERLHPLRLEPAKYKDRQRANFAADYVTNADIHRINVAAGMVCAGRYPFPLIDGCLHDTQISKDYSVEELYKRLKQPELPKGKQPADGDQEGDQEGDTNPTDAGNTDQDTGGTGSDAGNGKTQGDDKTTGKDTGGAAGDSGAGADDGDQGAGSDPDAGGAAGDADQAGTGAGGGSGSSNPSLSDLPGSGAPDLRQPTVNPNETLSDIEQGLKDDNERIRLQESLRSIGDGGGGYDRDIFDRPPVRLDWREYLAHWLLARSCTAWDKPINVPIYSATGLVSAGRDQATLDTLVIGVDTSGSVNDDEQGEMLASIRHAVETVKFETLHLLACDSSIRQHNEIQACDLTAMPHFIKGGGGTRFRPVFDWQAEHAPDAPIIYLTDGHSYDITSLKQPDVPVLWLSWDAPVEHYPFGEAIRIWL